MGGRWGNRCRHERGLYSATEAINAVAPAAKSKELNPRATRLGIAASDHTCALAHVSVDRAGRSRPAGAASARCLAGATSRPPPDYPGPARTGTAAGSAAGQGLEPQIRDPESRVLPITPSRNARSDRIATAPSRPSGGRLPPAPPERKTPAIDAP